MPWYCWLILGAFVLIGILAACVCNGGTRKPDDDGTGGYGDGSQVGDTNGMTMKHVGPPKK